MNYVVKFFLTSAIVVGFLLLWTNVWLDDEYIEYDPLVITVDYDCRLVITGEQEAPEVITTQCSDLINQLIETKKRKMDKRPQNTV